MTGRLIELQRGRRPWRPEQAVYMQAESSRRPGRDAPHASSRPRADVRDHAGTAGHLSRGSAQTGGGGAAAAPLGVSRVWERVYEQILRV